MTIRGLAVCLFTTFGLFACAQSPPAATADQQSALSSPAPTLPPGLEQPTPAMLRAALSGDPDAMRNEILDVGSCHTITTCPGFSVCTDWSSPAFCGDTCGVHCCHDPNCNEPDTGGNVFSEQSRVCFGGPSPCTEWNVTAHFVCGC
ncbi:MAG TPA: hypothetical protein VK601_26230 [Kofleriaceae bacterium]|nr:hypothetical protein [Kofleriaceae bacterium]